VDIYVANPFGSAGLRREEEMREKYDVRLKDAEVKNESVSVNKFSLRSRYPSRPTSLSSRICARI
jgi:hypothetical protein